MACTTCSAARPARKCWAWSAGSRSACCCPVFTCGGRKRGRVLAQLKMHAGPPVRRWLTWHRSTGVLLLPLLLLATLTGVGMVYSSGFQSALIAAFGGQDVQAEPRAAREARAIDWNRGAAAGADRTARRTPCIACRRPSLATASCPSARRRTGEWHPVGRSLVADPRRRAGVLQTYDATAQRARRAHAARRSIRCTSAPSAAPLMKWAIALRRTAAGVPAGHRLPVLAPPPRSRADRRLRALNPGIPARPLQCAACGSTAQPASFRIGPHQIAPRVILAPMAGVTDKPFRMLCKRLGAGLCVSEMTTSDPRFWNTAKSRHRMDHDGEPAPISVQIAGTVPAGDGRGGALQRRPRRADHRHQHGLPGQEGVQRLGRLGADARRSRWSRASSTPWCARSTCR